MSERRQDDLGRERQRRDGRPWGDGAVVRPERDASRLVVIEALLVSIDPTNCRAGTSTARQAPAVFAVSLERSRVPDRVLLLRERGPPAVLEVVDSARAHVVVMDASKVDPYVR